MMPDNGMGVSGGYIAVAIAMSALGVLLSAVYTVRVVHAYRVYHDERAAVSLAKAIGLFVMAIGLLLSSLGLVVEMASLSVAGMSIVRGAFIALMATLVLADIRPAGDEREDRDSE
jgi:hypothetical protein